MATWMTEETLDAVERWATLGGYLVSRETGCVLEGNGRVDAVLVPTAWDVGAWKGKRVVFGLLGVEVKTSRPDFLRGLREGQFERYRDDPGLAGVFVAAPRDVCKTKELPAGVGHLVLNDDTNKGRKSVIVTRRNPAIKAMETPSAVLWRLMLHMAFQHRCEVHAIHNRHQRAMERVGKEASRTIFTAVKKFTKALELGSD